MKIRKFVAAVAASAMAVSAMAVASSAAVTASIPFKDDGGGNWQLFLSGDNKVAEVGDIDPTKVASFDITLSFNAAAETDWAGGAVIAQSDSIGWGTIGQWENATGNGKEFEGVVSGKAFHVDMKNSFAADDGFTAIVFQNYGIDVNIDAITLYDASGAELISLGGASAPSTEAPAATEAPATDGTGAAGDITAPTPDKNSPNTGIEGVAVVAGLAIIAAGAVVVAKKRK